MNALIYICKTRIRNIKKNCFCSNEGVNYLCSVKRTLNLFCSLYINNIILYMWNFFTK